MGLLFNRNRHRVVGGGSVLPPYTPVATSFVWTKAPNTVNIPAIGLTDSVLAKVLDQHLVPMSPQPAITYTSGTPGNISISGNILTAVANGTSLITASTSGFSNLTGTATVTQVLSSITISPANPTVPNGTPQTFTANGFDSTAHAMSAGSGTWLSSDPTDFPIGSTTGICTPNVSSGSSVIKFTNTATGIFGTTTITASAAASLLFGVGGTQLTTLSGYPGFNSQLQIKLGTSWATATDITSRVILSSSNTAILTVDPPGLSSVSPTSLMQGTAGTFVFTDLTNNIKGIETISGLPTGVTASGYSYTSNTVTCTLTATGSATLGNATLSLTCNRGISPGQTITVVIPGPATLPISGAVFRVHADWNVTQSSGNISEWDDLLSTGAKFLQATGANKPTLVTNVINGHSVIRFSGSQWLALASVLSALNPTGQSTLYIFMKQSVSSNNGFVYSSLDASNKGGQGILCNDSNGRYQMWYGNGTTVQFFDGPTPAPNTTTFHMMTFVLDQTQPTKQNFLVDNSSVTGTADPYTANTTQPTAIGCDNRSGSVGTNTFHGDLGEIVLFPSAHNSTQIATMRTSYGQVQWSTP